MRVKLSHGKWDDGITTLSLVTPADNVKPVDENFRAPVGYEFDSEYDDIVRERDPTPITFYPEELRAVITAVRSELDEDPFAPDPDFDVLIEWIDNNGPGVIGEVGKRDGLHKQFRMKYNEEDVPYLKVQRGQGQGYLHATPTLGNDEFEGVFGGAVIL